MKYIIGITASKSKTQNMVNDSYIKAFNTEITTPIIIPNLFENKNEIISQKEIEDIQNHIVLIANSCDALVLSGGVDLNPTLLGEKVKDSEGFNANRDLFEKELVKYFLAQDKPILGICRGFQLLGNTIDLKYFQQDIGITEEIHDASAAGIDYDRVGRKEPIHNVHVFGEFKEYLKNHGLTEGKIGINSWHHQGFSLTEDGKPILNKDLENAINTLFGNIEIIMSTNRVIEGFQHKIYPILAFQNHPEEYENSLAIKYFVDKYLEKTLAT